MTLKIEVVPYQSDWIELFQEEKMQLTRVISEENFISLHHIGSTSVPSLSAKPIIDLLLVVKDISKLDLDNEKIASLG